MEEIDFNDNFKGFEDKEDILVDTGILLALLNHYDCWHTTVKELFDNHIFNNDNALFLYINPCIQNELTNLISNGKPLKVYIKKHPSCTITQKEIDEIETKSIKALKILIEKDILLILDVTKESSLKQLELYKQLGAADAVNTTLANEYGISFLTVDNRLVNNIMKNIDKLKDIHNLYFTTPKYKSY